MSADRPTSSRARRHRGTALLVAAALAGLGLATGALPSIAQVDGSTSSSSVPPTTSPPLTGPPLTVAPKPPPTPPATPVPTVPSETNAPPTTASPGEPSPPSTDGAPAQGEPTSSTTLPMGEPDGGPVIPGSSTPTDSSGDQGSGDTGAPVSEKPRLGDAQVASILESLQRSGANSTAALLDALRPLLALGISPQDAALLGMGHFPVAGPATFRDDWHDPRSTPTPHLHMGTDIFAAFGTPARAPMDGRLRYSEEGAGGKAAYVTTADGTWYYLAHLDGFVDSLKTGDTVTQGTVVGYVGDSGNARGGAPHVHFEVHPGGGEAVNPKPILDAWLAEAVAAAPLFVAAFTPPEQRVLTATVELRQLEASPAGAAPPAGSVLMWSSSISAGGGTVRLAESAAVRAAANVDWWKVELAAQARQSLERQAADEAFNRIAPLTPTALLPLLSNGS